MVDFHDYERTRKRQALAILAIVCLPAIVVVVTLALRTGEGWTAIVPGLIAAVSIYAAWDLSRVIVDPGSMHVEAVAVASRRRRFVRCAAVLVALFTCWTAFSIWIEAPSLWEWQLPGFLFALLAEGVYLAVTDTRLVEGQAASPRVEAPCHTSERLS